MIGLSGVLLWPSAVSAQDATGEPAQQRQDAKQQADKQEPETQPINRSDQPLSWARIDFILNRVNLVPRRSNARRARISDVLGIGDALQTFESSNAELRFNDGSEVRIGSQATFRFTPNTRNFQLTNGTVLLLIPPKKGRTTIQTPNAVTGIQGSALFVRYIEETDTTIVGALTDNPDGPMILYTNNGAEQQALYANQVGVVKGDRITELYEIDSRAFWETSGLAETFDYTEDVGPVVDELDGVRQEIRQAIENQAPIDSGNVVENPDSFSRPEPASPAEVTEPTDNSVEKPSQPTSEDEAEGSGNESGGGVAVEKPDLTIGGTGTEETEESEGQVIQYEGSPAEEFHNQNKPAVSGNDGTNALKPAPLTEAESEDEKTATTENGDRSNASANPSGTSVNQPGANRPVVTGNSRPDGDRPAIRPGSGASSGANSPVNSTPSPALGTTTAGENLIGHPVLPVSPNSGSPELIVPPSIGAGKIPIPPSTSTAQPNVPTGGVKPLPGSALQDTKPDKNPNNEDETGSTGTGSTNPPPVVSPDKPINPPPAVPSDKPIIEETNGAPNNPNAAEVVTPPAISEDEPGASLSVPGETGATLNNPSAAEAVQIPIVEVGVPKTPAADLVETNVPTVFEDELVNTDVLVVPRDIPLIKNIEIPAPVQLEGTVPVQLEGTVPFVVEQANDLSVEQRQR